MKLVILSNIKFIVIKFLEEKQMHGDLNQDSDTDIKDLMEDAAYGSKLPNGKATNYTQMKCLLHGIL
jgi:hypothetical protein